MGDLLQNLVDWMEMLPPFWAYAAILLIAYGENVVPPIPGDMVVVFGGYLVGIGELNFVMVVVLATIGGALGFMTMYAVGYAFGDALKDPERMRWIPNAQVGKAQQWLDRWGYWLVAANRFLSGLRSVISLAVGMARKDAARTAVFATLSAFLWTVLIAYGGYAVGENWHLIAGLLRDYGRAVIAAVALVLIGQTIRWYLKRSGSNARDAD